MKTLTVKREGTSTEFSYEIVWDGSYERLAGCVENLKLSAKKACIVTDSTVSELYLRKDGQEKKIADVTVAVGPGRLSRSGGYQMILHPALLEEKKGADHDIKSSDAGKSAV